MNDYKFLLKPVFYIFSLFFATWLVIKIEEIKPSDFGDDNNLINQNQLQQAEMFLDNKKYLKNVCIAFKAGAIDSTSLNKKLLFFVESTKSSFAK